MKPIKSEYRPPADKLYDYYRIECSCGTVIETREVSFCCQCGKHLVIRWSEPAVVQDRQIVPESRKAA